MSSSRLAGNLFLGSLVTAMIAVIALTSYSLVYPIWARRNAIVALERMHAGLWYREGSGGNESPSETQHPYEVIIFQEGMTGHWFSDTDMKFIEALPDLEGLHIIETRITDESLAGLRNHTNLRELTLRNGKLTDEGLKHLAHLKKLKHLNLRQTKVTKAGVEYIRSQLPGCIIEHD